MGAAREPLDGEFVEEGYVGGRHPQADAARTQERTVMHIDDLLAIPEHQDAVRAGLDCKLLPDATDDLGWKLLDGPLAPHGDDREGNTAGCCVDVGDIVVQSVM